MLGDTRAPTSGYRSLSAEAHPASTTRSREWRSTWAASCVACRANPRGSPERRSGRPQHSSTRATGSRKSPVGASDEERGLRARVHGARVRESADGGPDAVGVSREGLRDLGRRRGEDAEIRLRCARREERAGDVVLVVAELTARVTPGACERGACERLGRGDIPGRDEVGRRHLPPRDQRLGVLDVGDGARGPAKLGAEDAGLELGPTRFEHGQPVHRTLVGAAHPSRTNSTRRVTRRGRGLPA